MKAALRSLLAIVLGCMGAAMIIMLSETVMSMIKPPPPGFDFQDQAAMSAYIMAMSPLQHCLLLLGFAVGTFAGASLAARITTWAPLAHGLIVGVIMMCAGISNFYRLAHPQWVSILGVALFLPSAFVGAFLNMHSRPDHVT